MWERDKRGREMQNLTLIELMDGVDGGPGL